MQEALRVPEVSVLTRTPLRSPFRTSLANFKGGSPVIIGTTAAVLILCVVLLVIAL